MKRFLTLLLIIFSFSSANAKVILSPLLADDMVLQRDAEVRIWGKTEASKKVQVTPSWSGSIYSTVADNKGNWSVCIKTTGAGGPYTMEISDGEKLVLHNILLGDVWVCSGQSNMEIPLAGFTSQPIENALDLILESEKFTDIRVFTVKKKGATSPQEEVIGRWDCTSAEATPSFSAVAYLFAKTLNEVLDIPIGIIHTSWGGALIEAWMDRESMEKYPHFNPKEIQPGVNNPNRRPTMLYNSMVYPLRNLTIKGFSWYQGEANIHNYNLYPSMFKDLVYKWRSLFQHAEEAPFYFVQISPYSYGNSNKDHSAFLREAQEKCLSIPHTGMAVTLDVGEEFVIHPTQKEIVGKRLAYQALAKTYHVKIPCDGPVLKSSRAEKGKMTLEFDHVEGGIYPINVDLEAFEIAGENGVYVPAKAIGKSGSRVEVWSEKVNAPKYVRYGFKNYVKGCLYNGYHLPAGSFRTDDFKPMK